MNIPCHDPSRRTTGTKTRPDARQGSVLIIVLWVAFGLVSLALYFAHSMSFELRSADHRVAGLQAEQAIAGAVRYVSNLLANVETPGAWPLVESYYAEGAALGDAQFWLIGRDDTDGLDDQPVFALMDESSKLNLNTATLEMLQLLPRMSPELAAAIIDWRDVDEDITTGGAEAETYLRRRPAYHCKNAPFESVEELRLVAGAELEVLYGEDTNLNGLLDPNENDGDVTLPQDNRDGRLNPGLLEYVTVYSREPNTQADGTAKVNVTSANPAALRSVLEESFGANKTAEIIGKLGAVATIRSLLEFSMRSEMTPEEFALVENKLTVTNATEIEGRVNVNSASAEVLACLPGIGSEHAPALVAYRQANAGQLTSVSWVGKALDQPNAILAGPHLTAAAYQVTADVAAVGHHGRGYRRVKCVMDMSQGAPKVIFRRDLTHLGWATGRQARELLALTREGR